MCRFLILILTFITVSNTAICQEVFIDTLSNKQNIFLGAYTENLDSMKTLEDGVIKWKYRKNLEQEDILSGEDFITEIFHHKLCFLLGGYEPFWSVKIVNKNKLVFHDFDSGEDKECEINIFVNNSRVAPEFYIMFKNIDNNVFGLINYLGWFRPEQRLCEYNISEEISLYEAYVCINGKTYKGCAIIEKE